MGSFKHSFFLPTVFQVLFNWHRFDCIGRWMKMETTWWTIKSLKPGDGPVLILPNCGRLCLLCPENQPKKSRDFWDLCLNKMQRRKCFNVIFTCSFKTSARHKHIQYVRPLRPLHVRWMAQSWSQEYQSEDSHLSCLRYGKIVNRWTLKILASVFSLI